MPQNQNQAPEQISKKMMFESGHYRMIDVNIYLSDKPVFRYGLNKVLLWLTTYRLPYHLKIGFKK